MSHFRDPQRASAVVVGWCRWYTRGLPDTVARPRRDELDSDLYEHRADAELRGASAQQVARSILARALLGVHADLSWRTYQIRAARLGRAKEARMNRTMQRDGWTTTARILSALVAAWSVFAVAAMWLTSDASPMATGMLVTFCAGCVLAIYGLGGLGRRPVPAAWAIAAAAVLTTVPVLWFALIPVVGVSIAAFFAAYALRTRRPVVPAGAQ